MAGALSLETMKDVLCYLAALHRFRVEQVPVLADDDPAQPDGLLDRRALRRFLDEGIGRRR